MDGNAIAEIITSLIWAGLVLTIVILLRNDISRLFARISNVNIKDGNLKFDTLNAQRKALEEFKESVSLEYKNASESVHVRDLISLMDQKLKGLDGKVQKMVYGQDIRSNLREKHNENIDITRSDGVVVDGRTQDKSMNGIGFISSTHLNRNEVITIVQNKSDSKITDFDSTLFLIKRVEPRGNEFYYGAIAVIQNVTDDVVELSSA